MPTITFGGVGSGIDTESIITGLLSASNGPLQRVQQQRTQTQSAFSSVSDLGNLLSKLKDAVTALDTVREVGSFSVTSDTKGVVATAAGNAELGSFEVEVTQVASAYKAYSNALGVTQANEPLGRDGVLSLSVNGQTADIDLDGGDTLTTVLSKINGSGLAVSASSFFDGTSMRIQLRGLESGAENDVSINEGETALGFAENLRSRGQDAQFTVDGFAMTSKTNQVQGVIKGVTLALTEETTEPAKIEVASDPAAFQTKIQTLVDSYNAVISKVHADAGFGSAKPQNALLAGDSTLRRITSRLSATLTQATGTGKFQTMRSIGVELNNNGTLKLNKTALDAALAEDPGAVTRVLAGDDEGVAGLADMLADVTTEMLSAQGLITTRKDALQARQKQLTDQTDVEQRRLDRMETLLRKQFNMMDQLVTQARAEGSTFG